MLKPYSTNFFTQRAAASYLVFVQLLVTAVLMETVVLSLCAGVLALIALFTQNRRWGISLPGDWWVYFVGAFFIVKYSFAPRSFPIETEFLFTDFSYEVAMFCVVVELLMLYRKQDQEKLPTGFLVFAVIGIIFSCNVRLDSFRRISMLVLSQGFFLASMLFSIKSRRITPDPLRKTRLWRYSIMWSVLVFASSLGTLSSVLLYRYEHTLEKLLANYLSIGDQGPARSGFSNRGGLNDVSSWQNFGADEVALRVDSKYAPGYLRGKVFDEFHMNRWMVTRRSWSLYPTQTDVDEIDIPAGDSLYLIGKNVNEDAQVMHVWPVDNETAGHCFIPMNIVALSCVSKPLSIDRNGILTRPNERKVAKYSIYYDSGRKFIDTSVHGDYLQLPGDLDERVVSASAKVFQGAETSTEKIRQVQEYFQANYKYHLGVKIPRGEDPLGYFIEKRPAAHCEYFATASVVLLRHAGVPARYVTGYIAQEKNAVDSMWIARRKHAHAWVEAYDENTESWVLVESTPGEGIPVPTEEDIWRNRREALAHYFRTLQDQIVRGQYLKVFWNLLQPFVWLMVAGGGLGILWMVLQRRRAREAPAEVDEQNDYPELILERQKMDRMMARNGFERISGETTTRFAERIENDMESDYALRLAAWYRKYTACRFRPGDQAEHVTELRLERKELKHQRLERVAVSIIPEPGNL